jgi:hypothetical protein
VTWECSSTARSSSAATSRRMKSSDTPAGTSGAAGGDGCRQAQRMERGSRRLWSRCGRRRRGHRW